MVCTSGTPGSGKTTLCTKLAGVVRERLGIPVVSLVQEYARTYISRYGVPKDMWEQIRILRKQLAEEDRVLDCDILFTDSPYQLGLLYAMDLPRTADEKGTLAFNDLFKMMAKANLGHHYDLVLHLPPVLKPVQDGVRAEHQFDHDWRVRADQDIRFIFRLFPPREFLVLEPTLPENWDRMSDLEQRRRLGELRVDMAVEHIAKHLAEREKAGEIVRKLKGSP